MHSSKSSKIFCYHSRVDSQILTTTSRPSVKPCMVTSRIASVEQTVNALFVKMAMFAAMEQNVSTFQPQALHAPQDRGKSLVKTMAPQQLGPSGPIAQGHPMRTETHDEELILSPAPKMKNHEAPSYFDSLANNTSKRLQSGSIPFGKNPICRRVTNLSEFIAKQVPCQSGLSLKHEANVKTLLLDIRMMVFLTQLTVPSAAPIQLSQCVNPDQLKTERLENNLRLCGKSWLTNLKFSFLMEMTKVFSSSQRSMLAHKSPASKIAETELENWFSNLLRLEADKRLLLLHLICLFLVFHLKCCNGAPSPPSFFAARVEALFLLFPVSMDSTFGGLFDSRCYFA